MSTNTLGPLARQAPHRPLAAIPEPSLLERGCLAARQFEPRAVVERLRAGIGEKPGIVLAPPTIAMRTREPWRAPSGLLEQRAVVATRRESALPELDVQPFVMAVRGLIEAERITAARDMLAAAPAYMLGDPLVARLCSVLAPPVARRTQKRDVDRTQEYDWLRTHGREYRGRWVALLGGALLVSAPTLRELQEQLRTADFSSPPLLHRVG